ncbi:hypothetical protein HYQ46_009273 [Verticillium longisporum]|nr:hypothetical protein HYQ46_009273 [Verticillium longisporum]
MGECSVGVSAPAAVAAAGTGEPQKVGGRRKLVQKQLLDQLAKLDFAVASLGARRGRNSTLAAVFVGFVWKEERRKDTTARLPAGRSGA